MHIKVLIVIIVEKMDFFLHWGFMDYGKNLTICIDFLFYFFDTLHPFCLFGQGVLAPTFHSETLSSSIFSGH